MVLKGPNIDVIDRQSLPRPSSLVFGCAAARTKALICTNAKMNKKLEQEKRNKKFYLKAIFLFSCLSY